MTLTMRALPDIPLIHEGDALAAIILQALGRAEITLTDGDVLVIASKIISKIEGRFVHLDSVMPTPEAERIAQETGKDPRIVELTLQESQSVSRTGPNILVTRHRLGFVSANAGIDQSNVGRENTVLLLPYDPDASAAALRDALLAATGARVGVVVSDTHGRPFRMGNVGVAIGVAGMPAVVDLRGTYDLFGRVMKVSTMGFADLVASAAHLLCGEGAEGTPVTWIRGLVFDASMEGCAADLVRPPQQDLYR